MTQRVKTQIGRGKHRRFLVFSPNRLNGTNFTTFSSSSLSLLKLFSPTRVPFHFLHKPNHFIRNVSKRSEFNCVSQSDLRHQFVRYHRLSFFSKKLIIFLRRKDTRQMPYLSHFSLPSSHHQRHNTSHSDKSNQSPQHHFNWGLFRRFRLLFLRGRSSSYHLLQR
ncbi:hypothetical protein BLNAU_11592 [Blattamonas nauphoetae]|uniref:Uncharacterized protein n=1 Tax=Blattamonas nauphoetae TaxID=2049346 RepID=A0ABQ9XM14_9EUKA|nr:hypothetical protein BLNAU_11592 [Blattamonas nauphoetae]